MLCNVFDKEVSSNYPRVHSAHFLSPELAAYPYKQNLRSALFHKNVLLPRLTFKSVFLRHESFFSQRHPKLLPYSPFQLCPHNTRYAAAHCNRSDKTIPTLHPYYRSASTKLALLLDIDVSVHTQTPFPIDSIKNKRCS